jgi:hypothetical protein
MTASPVSRARLQASLASVVTAALWWHFGGVGPAAIAGTMSLLALIAWLAPTAYAPVQRFFDRVTHALLTGFTWIALAVVYFGVFVPMRGFRALSGRDPLRLRPTPNATTYFQSLPREQLRRFDRQF